MKEESRSSAVKLDRSTKLIQGPTLVCGTMAIEATSVVPDRSRVRGLVREKRFRADVGKEDVIEEVQAFVEDI